MTRPLIPCPNCGEEISKALGNRVDGDSISLSGKIIKTPQIHCDNCSAEVGETFASVVNSYSDLISGVFGGRGSVALEDFRDLVRITNELLDTLPTSKGKLGQEQALRLGFGLTTGQQLSLREVGKAVGVSPGYVLSQKEKALRSLRHPTRSKRLRYFFGRGPFDKLNLVQENTRLKYLLGERDRQIRETRREVDYTRAFLIRLKDRFHESITKMIEDFTKG